MKVRLISMNARDTLALSEKRKEIKLRRQCMDFLFKTRIRIRLAAMRGETQISSEVIPEPSEFFMKHYAGHLTNQGYRVELLKYCGERDYVTRERYHKIVISWAEPLMLNAPDEE